MRLISASFLGGCLLGVIVGCSSKPRVEVPTNPTPPPKGGMKLSGVSQGATKLPTPPPPGARPLPPKQ